MSEQHVMASLPAIAEGAATEEQLLVAEASSVSRNADLKKMRQDKREFIKATRRALANSPKFGETFGKIQSTDLPPQFRAILEDNRMLHEQIRTYKRDLYDTQASHTALDRHIVRLQAEVKRMHEALQDCSQSPGEVSAQRDAARTIWQQEEDLQKLQDRVSVLVHAKETDGRRFKQIAMERQREREELKREVERLKGLVSERDKAFRAQAFALKQANTRVAQLQQQQAELAIREAALMQELSHGTFQTAESLLSATEHGSSLKKMQSRLPSGMETIRRRLEPILSTGSILQPAMTSEEEDEQEEETPVKLMLIVLNEDAIQGFHAQVVEQQEAAEREEGRGPHEAATLIQSAWRKRQAQQELQRLRQLQENQAEAAAQQAQAERMEPPISPGKGLGAAKGMRRGPSKIKNPPSQAEVGPKSPTRKSIRPSLALGGPNSPTARNANTGSPQSREKPTTSSMPSSKTAAGISSDKVSQAPSRQASSVRRPDSSQA